MRLPLIGLLALGLVFTACAPRALDRSSFAGQDVIGNFQTDRGEGGAYKVGELVKLSFTLLQAGYITLVSMDPDTTTGEVERSIAVKAGNNVLPRANDVNATGAKAAYKVFPPAGRQRIILLFTDTPIAKTVRFEGKLDEDALSAKINAYFGQAKTRDVAETSIEVEQ
jgi:Domain of unknown function (DUF4384)